MIWMMAVEVEVEKIIRKSVKVMPRHGSLITAYIWLRVIYVKYKRKSEQPKSLHGLFRVP
jgi:hypothetical protein